MNSNPFTPIHSNLRQHQEAYQHLNFHSDLKFGHNNQMNGKRSFDEGDFKKEAIPKLPSL